MGKPPLRVGPRFHVVHLKAAKGHPPPHPSPVGSGSLLLCPLCTRSTPAGSGVPPHVSTLSCTTPTGSGVPHPVSTAYPHRSHRKCALLSRATVPTVKLNPPPPQSSPGAHTSQTAGHPVHPCSPASSIPHSLSSPHGLPSAPSPHQPTFSVHVSWREMMRGGDCTGNP